ncbi:MAG TPA: hypothetical protein VNN80_03825 [Polyangiaceae bacterium]|nr:hypothetical protein [Polyangiaceae bacterium]
MKHFDLRLARLSFRARLIGVVLVAFTLLVNARVHGSSIALSASLWAPQTAMERFVASPWLREMTPEAAARWRGVLQAEPRSIRIDEWAHETLWALSQFTHEPRFPVVNENYGNGQNMLLLPWIPVAHVSAIARPMTWGYMLFGPQRGLAWAWWSQVFGCFIALYLLFELIEPRRPWLAVLGAGWFCGSAYVVCWSLWPAYTTGLGVATVVCAHWLLHAKRPAVILACGAGIGICFSGFAMQLYPPWQVPLGHTFLALFVGLCLRDRPWRTWRQQGAFRLGGLALGVALLALCLGSVVLSSLDALQAFANSEYPGQRRLLGGDAPAWRLFAGLYNAFTMDLFTDDLNPSEIAGFFSFMPAVVLCALLSPRLARRLGPVVWALVPVAVLLGVFCVTEVPGWLATGTLLSMAQGFRAQIALGLISIIFSVRLLAVTSQLPLDRWALLRGAFVLIACGAFYLWQGREFDAHEQLLTRGPWPTWLVPAVSAAAALLSLLLALGWSRPFAALLALGLVATSGSFNPLSVGFPDWRRSELRAAIRGVLEREPKAEGPPSLWLTYGGQSYPNNGILAQLMGARPLGGVYEYPQPEFWTPLDPKGRERSKYNRYLNARLMPTPLNFKGVRFRMATYLMMRVWVSPLNRALREMGARYVLTFGSQPTITSPPMTSLYTAADGSFAIWELPSEQ